MHRNIKIFVGVAGALWLGLLATMEANAQSTKKQLEEIREAILSMKSQHDDLKEQHEDWRDAIESRITDLNYKVETTAVLGQESLGLIRDLMDSVDGVRDEQASQLEEILETRIQIPTLVERLTRVEKALETQRTQNISSIENNLAIARKIKKIEARLSSGFITRTIRDQEALRGELAHLRGTVEEMELAQEKFASRLRRFYDDLDFRLRQLVIAPVISEEPESPETNDEQLENFPEPAVDNPQVDPINEVTDEPVSTIGPSESDLNSDINATTESN